MFKDEQRNIFEGALPQENREILYGLISGLFFLATFFGAPVLGALSGRFGRKNLLAVTAIFTTIGFTVVGLGIQFKNVEMVFAGRIMAGLFGSIIVIINSSIADVSNLKSKARNFGITGVAFGIAFIIGPLIGATLSDNSLFPWFDYQLPYFMAAIVTLLNVIFIYAWYPETLQEKNYNRISLFTSVRNIVWAFSNRSLRSIFPVMFILALGFSFYVQFFQIFIINKYALTQTEIGFMLFWVGGCVAFAQGVVLRIISKKFSSISVLKFSIPAMSVTFILMLLPQNPLYFALLIPFMAVAQGLTFPNALAIISNSADDNVQGEIIGINQSVQIFLNLM